MSLCLEIFEASTYPITPEQHAIWIIDKLRAGRSIEFNVGYPIFMPSPVDPFRLKQAIYKLLTKYAVLRSFFSMQDGNIIARIAKITDIKLKVLFNTHNDLNKKLYELASQPFNLLEEPAIRFYLIPSSNKKEGLDTILILHHSIVHDGCSTEIIINDLKDFYHGRSNVSLGDKNLSFIEWAKIQKKNSYSQDFITYWRHKLEGYQATKLELGKPWKPRQTNQGQQFSVYLEREMAEPIRILASDCQANIFTILLGAFFILLERYSQKSDLTIATINKNRLDPRTQNTIGFFLNTPLLRTKLDKGKSFKEFIKDNIKPTVLEALAYSQVPFDMIIAERYAGSLFHIVLVYHNEGSYLPQIIYNKTTKHDLLIDIFWVDSRLEFRFEYSTELYSHQLMQDFAHNYLKIFKYIADHQDDPIEIYDLSFRNHTPPNPLWTKNKYSCHTILDIYSQVAITNSSKTLIEFGNEGLSASAFWHTVKIKACQLQEILNEHFKHPPNSNKSIGISGSRSLETLSDMVAILFSGFSFVPYDPHDPKDRINYILNDANINVRLNHGKVYFSDDDIGIPLAQGMNKTLILYNDIRVNPDQCAYIIYTSGSTGKPKGVRISHRALWHYTQWFGSLELNGLCQKIDFSTNLAFDAAITTSLVALANDKSIYVCPREIKNSPHAFLNYLIEKEIDLCKSTPSYFKLLLKESLYSQVKIPQDMIWLLGGEEMNQKDCATWLELYPSHCFYNSYGPTEATVTCSKFKVDKNNIEDFQNNIPIEKNSRSCWFHIVDSNMREVPYGVKGELCIEGPILANGYQNKPKETNSAFVKNADGGLWYRTGDQVMSLTDGTIYYFGRQDEQVKIRGIRVELDEIRQVICSLKYIADARIIINKDQTPLQLFAFITPSNLEINKVVLCDKVHRYLLRKIPAALVPQHIIVLDKLPLNNAAKVDIQALCALAKNHSIKEGKMLVTCPFEMSLLGIWREYLPLNKIGTDSNFFNLGGNSLLAMEVMDKINSLHNISLPPDLIFQKPNIRELSQAICDQNLNTNLYHFHHCQEGPALFMIHPATGIAHIYQGLNKFLEFIDFYGLSNDRFGDLENPYETIEDMASSYIKILMQHRPNGPYILGGFCTGGVVAFEMIRQLKHKGNLPMGLVLIDSFNLQHMGSQKERKVYNQNQLKLGGISEGSYFGQKLIYELEHNRHLAVKYQPCSFSTDCLFFECQNLDSEDISQDYLIKLKNSLNGWQDFLDPARIKRVVLNASHQSIFRDEQVISSLGKEINQFIHLFG